MHLPGCQEDIDSLIRQTSDAAQLATWCTVYKAELARKRTECNGLTESLRRARRDLEQLQAKHSNQSTELNIATGRVATLEEDIAAQVGYWILEILGVLVFSMHCLWQIPHLVISGKSAIIGKQNFWLDFWTGCFWLKYTGCSFLSIYFFAAVCIETSFCLSFFQWIEDFTLKSFDTAAYRYGFKRYRFEQCVGKLFMRSCSVDLS